MKSTYVKPQLIYFDIRGRAEAIRLLLEDVACEYEDIRVPQDDWSAIRPTTPFGRVPVYREGEMEVPETYAIINYLGRKFGLLGGDESSRVRCDVAVEALRDYGNRIAVVFGAKSSGSDDGRREFIQDELPERLSALQNFYISNSVGNEYWAGESVTVADYVAFYFIEGVRDQFPKALAHFEGLAAFHMEFASRPRIRDYLVSGRRPTALFFGPSGKIYPRKD